MALQGVKLYVDWEEHFVSHDRGSRIVHYYLRDRHGQSSLAVVGTERSLRHMVYVVCDEFLPLAGLDKSAASSIRWRARREVVEWLQTLLMKSRATPDQYLISDSPAASSDVDTLIEETDEALEGRSCGYLERVVRRKANAGKCDFVCGSSVSRKRLRHFQSFTRNGITISVHSFVYVLTEEVRHTAYVEDMYEDSEMEKKLRVRWFHKPNELACKIPPPAPHAREMFYTSFSQVVSVDCVDGLAAVLSPEHFELCANVLDMEAAPHVCCRQFDSNEGIRSFNVLDVKGYWQQQVLSQMGMKAPIGLTCSMLYTELGCEDLDIDEEEAELGNVIRRGPRTARSSRRRAGSGSQMRDEESGMIPAWATPPVDKGCSTGDEGVNPVEHRLDFKPGDEIEVLSQDSGLRGCWFKATITRRVSKRLKVRYDKLQNEDGEGNLEEWVSAWRLAEPDKSGMRMGDRNTVRPFASFNVSPGECNIGQAVDAWWTDGWWEGIITNKDPSGDVEVYFPGEGDTSSFKTHDLRTSRDWVNDAWIDVRSNPNAFKASAHLKPETPRIVNEIRTSTMKQHPCAF